MNYTEMLKLLETFSGGAASQAGAMGAETPTFGTVVPGQYTNDDARVPDVLGMMVMKRNLSGEISGETSGALSGESPLGMPLIQALAIPNRLSVPV